MRWLTDALEVSALLPEERAQVPGGSESIEDSAASSEPAPTTLEEAELVSAEAGQSDRAPAVSARTGRGTARRVSKRSRAAKRGKATDEPARERVYRRMPPAEDVLNAYAEIGTISGLAQHYGVPRHTVQGWARRLRTAGHVIGRKPS
ncbi:MAG: hypothetical protein HKP61_11160 [Dactylosporangium sp.]|nr:hypothetical protein [Dactylosporangium sp.]NNJ61484.1 hypothetical protein [Dactylosporangium sp.]